MSRAATWRTGVKPCWRSAASIRRTTRRGDDVDVCWRLQARGLPIGFAPSALVWHRHRRSVRAYWRQQVGYGEAETQLMGNHPERFLNGHAVWKGRIYSPLPFVRAISRVRVNAGVWGTAAFPSVYSAHIPSMTYVPHLMQWQVGSVLLGIAAVAAFRFGQPAFGVVAAAAAAGGIAITVWKCIGYGWQTELRGLPRIRPWGARASRAIYRATIAWLHLVQPVARGWGRLRGRLWPPEVAARRAERAEDAPARGEWPRDAMRALRLMSRGRVGLRFWSEQWVDRADLLTRIARRLEATSVGRAIDAHDTWQQERDLAVATGRWGWLDLRTLMEEHGQGRCLFRVTARYRLAPFGATVGAAVACAIGASLLLGSMAAAVVCAGAGAVAAARMGRQIAQVDAGVRAVIAQVAEEQAMQSMARAPAPPPPAPAASGHEAIRASLNAPASGAPAVSRQR